LLRSSLSR